MTSKVRVSHGLKQLLSSDPGQVLLHAVEAVQEQAHHRRLGRVLRQLQRRKESIGWIHVSDAYEPCDRVLGAKLLGYKLPREAPGPRLQRIFENGTYMHLRWYNSFLSLPPPYEVAVAVLLRDWPIIGEADVIVKHPAFNQFIIELKSINGEQFKALKGSKSDHQQQLNSYLGLDESGVDQGLVWYECKNTQDVKIYSEQFDPEPYYQARGRIERLAELILQGQLPKGCGVCNLDEHIGELQGIEDRMTAMKEVRDTWQKLIAPQTITQ